MTTRYEWLSEGREFDPHSGHQIFAPQGLVTLSYTYAIVLRSTYVRTISTYPFLNLDHIVFYDHVVSKSFYKNPLFPFPACYSRHKLLAAD